MNKDNKLKQITQREFKQKSFNSGKQGDIFQKVADLNKVKSTKCFPLVLLLIRNRIVINRKKMEDSLKEVKSLKYRR